MAILAKRLLTICLALALLVGVTVQPMPSSMVEGHATVRADMGGSAGPQPPCTGLMPHCVDQGCCVTGSALPSLPASVPVMLEWTSLDYDFAPKPLSGISIKPELLPPILAA